MLTYRETLQAVDTLKALKIVGIDGRQQGAYVYFPCTGCGKQAVIKAYEARKRKFDVLLVWKLDRLSRSLKDLINTLDGLGSLGIHFISYDNNRDTTNANGKANGSNYRRSSRRRYEGGDSARIQA